MTTLSKGTWRVGFIGLGIMGTAMASRLLQDLGTLAVHDIDPAHVAPLAAKGAAPMSTPAAVGAACNIVITMLPDTDDVEAVVFGRDSLLGGLQPESILIDMSTVSPIATCRWSERLSLQGVSLVDAPVSGGHAGALAGTLSIMAGGAPDAFDRVCPLLALLGKSIVHMGPSGSGQLAKACNQLLIANILVGLGEAFLLAEKSDLSFESLIQVLQGGAAQTRFLEIAGPRMLTGNYAGGFRTRLHRKDVRLAIEAAQAAGLDLSGTGNAFHLLDAAVAAGWADQDHSALFEFLRQRSHN